MSLVYKNTLVHLVFCQIFFRKTGRYLILCTIAWIGVVCSMRSMLTRNYRVGQKSDTSRTM